MVEIFLRLESSENQGSPQISSPDFSALSAKLTYITQIMDMANATAKALRKQISETEAQLERLKLQLVLVEADESVKSVDDLSLSNVANNVTKDQKWPLSAEEYKRYGRQMIVPSIGIQG